MLKFCIMLVSLHVKSQGTALGPAHVSACSMEGQEQQAGKLNVLPDDE